MLTKKQITEIREHLEKAQNPLFFFDIDVDGLSSFLLLQRYIGRGRGVVIRGSASLGKSYFRKVRELKPDYIFVLDKPVVDDEFIELAKQENLPLVVIDHHNVPAINIENYYNTYHTSKKNEPVAYLCYKIAQKKQDLWLAVAGCIGDCYLPDFLPEFKKQHPELLNSGYKHPYDILYNSQIGKIANVLNFGLKDTTTNAVNMMKYLMKVKGPYDVLEENSQTKSFLSRYDFINSKIQSAIKKAKTKIDKKNKLLFYTYSGDMSLSQHISDELIYLYPDLVVIVGFIKGNTIKFSLRGEIDIRKLTQEAIKDIEGAVGGGHKHATGTQMMLDQRGQFKKNILKLLNKI